MASIQLNLLLHAVPVLVLSSLAAAQNGDGGGASGNVPASSTAGGNAAGAAGNTTGLVSLSTGAIIAIAIVVSVVCILGILFFIAKKRQWTMRETLRRSKRRVASGIKTVMSPLTPHRATFSPGPLKTRFSEKETKGIRGSHPLKQTASNNHSGLGVSGVGAANPRDRDLEKGEGSRVVVSEKKTTTGHKPQKPSITIPINGKKVEEPKTPMYNRFFGRE